MKPLIVLSLGFVAVGLVRAALLWHRDAADRIGAWRALLGGLTLGMTYLAMSLDVPTRVPVAFMVAYFAFDIAGGIVNARRRAGLSG